MILLDESRAKEGFSSGRAAREVCTRCVGSGRKCLVDMVMGW